jgi:hypothetical protein
VAFQVSDNEERLEVQRFNQGSLLVKESPEKMLWLIGIVVALVSGAGVTLLGIKRKVKIVETPMIKLRKPELADLSWWHTTQFQWIKDEVELTKKIIEGLENIIQGSSDEPTREVVQLIIEELKEKLKTIHYLASFTDDVNPKEPPTAPNG